MKGIEKILNGEKLIAIIGKTEEMGGKSHFVTPEDFSFQLAVQNSSINEYWKPHKHLCFKNLEFLQAQEIIYVIKGEINLEIYSEEDKKITERVLNPTEFAILGYGHSIKSLEYKTKFMAIKQGPYREGEKILLE